MTDDQAAVTDIESQTFEWHPRYRGRTVGELERELSGEIAQDQRAYELALSGAEASEHEALASVMELEKRWSDYSFGWAEMEPDALAGRIVAFEWERERRREMIPYETYRDSMAEAEPSRGGGWRASMSDTQRRKAANVGAGMIMAAIVLIVIVVLLIVL